MRANVVILAIIAIFLVIVSAAYWLWSGASTPNGEPEWAGALGITLSGVLCAFIAFYLWMGHRSQGGELPEDLEHAMIDDGDPELGFFSPWSWWPIVIAGGAALTILGLAVGSWLCFIGVPIALVALVGWVFEYYRGNFAR